MRFDPTSQKLKTESPTTKQSSSTVELDRTPVTGSVETMPAKRS